MPYQINDDDGGRVTIIRTDSRVDAVTMHKGQAHVRRYAKVQLPVSRRVSTSPNTPTNTPVASTDAVDQVVTRQQEEANDRTSQDCDGGAEERVNSMGGTDLCTQAHRFASAEQGEGEEVHIYFAMPTSFDEDSVQVRFDAFTAERVVLRGVFFETADEGLETGCGNESSNEGAQKPEDEIGVMKDKLREVVRARAVNKLQQEELDHGAQIATNLFDRACGPLTDDLGEALTANFWKVQIDGVEERTERCLKEKRKLQEEDAVLAKEEMDIDRQIELMGRRRVEVEGTHSTPLRHIIMPTTDATSGADSASPIRRCRFCCIVLKAMGGIPLSTVYVLYISHDASWRCEYEVALDSEKRELTLQYNAVIHGGVEDFDDVALTLSSAAPRRNAGRVPKLKPWRLEAAEARSDDATGKEVSNRAKLPSSVAGAVTDDSSSGEESELPDEPWNVEGNECSPGGVVNFPLPGRYTIRAMTRSAVDACTDLRVPIATRRWKAKVKYVAVPSLSEGVYVVATCTNEATSEGSEALVILSGKASVLLDGDFVASCVLERTLPGDELKVHFGADPSIEIRRDFLKEKQVSAGTFLGFVQSGCKERRRTTYTYKTTVVNKKPTEPVRLTLHERVPKSSDEELIVRLIEPVNHVVDKEQQRGDFEVDGLVDIEITLEPGESRTVGFSFVVDAPLNAHVDGL